MLGWEGELGRQECLRPVQGGGVVGDRGEVALVGGGGGVVLVLVLGLVLGLRYLLRSGLGYLRG